MQWHVEYNVAPGSLRENRGAGLSSNENSQVRPQGASAVLTLYPSSGARSWRSGVVAGLE